MSKKEETVQDRAHAFVHAVFKNNRKEIFPFLKIFFEKSCRSSKEILKLSDEQAKSVISFAEFFSKELAGSYQLPEVKGEMHRHFLWNSTKDELRVLLLMRKERDIKQISRILKISSEWVREIQMEMLSKGAAMGNFTHIESMMFNYARDPEYQHDLAASYNSNLERFMNQLRFYRNTWDRDTCLHITAYYAREMLAKTLLGGNYEPQELAI